MSAVEPGRFPGSERASRLRMRVRALATDYDGTVATRGAIAAPTLAALDRLRGAGGVAILVTGRVLDDLRRVCPWLDRFARVVAENGAVLHDPARDEVRDLAPPVPRALFDVLRARDVPVDRGRVLLATREPHDAAVLDAIDALGLELQIVRNKGAVMVLPAGVDKGTGVRAALDALGLAPDEAVGVGDAENDDGLLGACGTGVAVANALDALRARADWVTRGAAGEGVIEVIEWMVG